MLVYSWAGIELNNIAENLNCKHIVLHVFDLFYSATETVKIFLTIDDCMFLIWYCHFYAHPMGLVEGTTSGENNKRINCFD